MDALRGLGNEIIRVTRSSESVGILELGVILLIECLQTNSSRQTLDVARLSTLFNETKHYTTTTPRFRPFLHLGDATYATVMTLTR